MALIPTVKWDTSQVPNFLVGATVPLIMDWENLRERIEYFMRHDHNGLLRAKAFNQKTLAVKAGLHATAVRDIRKGRSKNPELRTVKAIAQTLGVPLETLTESPGDFNHSSTLLSENVHTKAGKTPRKDSPEMKMARLGYEIGTIEEPQYLEELIDLAKQRLVMLQRPAGTDTVRPRKPGKAG